jgi:PhoPQ-activated pathogenicity-related protein
LIDIATKGLIPGRKHAQSVLYMCLTLCLVSSGLVAATALDDYVAAPDSHYTFSQVGSASSDTYTNAYVLDLTSQAWRTEAEVDLPIWHHWLTVIVPKSLFLTPPVKDTALLLIDGGNTNDAPPAFDVELRQLSAATRTVIVRVSAVPNEPLRFSDEASARTEDEIIAYSWNKYFETGDETWPAQLPMVKAVVRAMDATKSFVASSAGGSKTVNRFVLVGGSKRGWTAWLTAAVDPRVRAICPIVSDLVNMRVSFAHHWAAYGFWAEALRPYEDMGIFDRLETDEGAALLRIVDPYAYLDRLTMPKFIVNAAGDNFFVSDSVRFYLHDLPGETYLRHVPNTDHYLTGAYDQIVNGMVPYYDALLNGDRRPRFTWTLQADGSIRVQATDKPKSVRLWQAANSSTRDFRMTTIGAGWTSSTLSDLGSGVYVGQVPEPGAGWVAFFVELIYTNPFSQEYSSSGEFDYHFTTQMQVLPKAVPFPDMMLAPVYRFWSPVASRHFYTINQYEKNAVIDDYPDSWSYEGVAYHAHMSECDWGLQPVYRFWSGRLGSHFYTIDENEKEAVIANYPGVWSYEGVAFHAYPEGEQPAGTQPVYRFWSGSLGCHFYTTDEAEKDYVIAEYAYTWTYEGIAWYAFVVGPL